jgi:hypothetical protein
LSEEDGITHDWAAITVAEEGIVAELRAAGWTDTRAIYQEATRRVKLGDYVAQGGKPKPVQVVVA